jgi:hypothetical protein
MNPFRFGQTVSGEDFADREDEIETIIRDLKSGQSILIHSPRRYGKTSLIKEVFSRLDVERQATVYMDLYRVFSKKRFIETYSALIFSAVESRLDEVGRLLREYLPRPKITLTPEEYPMPFTIELGASLPKREEDQLFQEILEAPQKLAEKKDKRFFVAFDEFQEIARLDGYEVESTMRSIFQHHNKVSYAFLGSRRRLLQEIFNDKGRPFYKSCKSIPLEAIPEEEFTEFLTNRFKDGGLNVPRSTVSRILQVTKCHPYYTQQLCHEVWNGAYPLERDLSEQEWLTIINNAVEGVIAANRYAYEEIYDRLAESQRRLAYALSTEPTKNIYSTEYIQRYSLRSAPNVAKALHVLEERELVEKTEQVYKISDIFFAQWLTRIE